MPFFVNNRGVVEYAVDLQKVERVLLSITTTPPALSEGYYAFSVTSASSVRGPLRSLSRQQLTWLIPQLERLWGEMLLLLDDQRRNDSLSGEESDEGQQET